MALRVVWRQDSGHVNLVCVGEITYGVGDRRIGAGVTVVMTCKTVGVVSCRVAPVPTGPAIGRGRFLIVAVHIGARFGCLRIGGRVVRVGLYCLSAHTKHRECTRREAIAQDVHPGGRAPGSIQVVARSAGSGVAEGADGLLLGIVIHGYRVIAVS
ncbi:hypothetical protein BMS3Abin14_00584 [bacterium BMS3Abin14]|nr:hypothetical protein BMS3Abin14_00584 [bacterium BMS3Abin14]